MHPQTQEITLYNNATPVTVTSSTNATPSVVTATAHGFLTGQRVLIYGQSTNTAGNGIFLVTRLTANTFSIQDEITGANVAANGIGSGGIAVAAPPVPLLTGFRNAILQFGTTGTATLTVKVTGSLGIPNTIGVTSAGPRYDYPNMGATVSPTNPYNFLQIIPLDTQTALAGNTGIALSGADTNNNYEININAIKYCTLIPTAWTQGAITAKLLLSTNA